MLERLLDMLKQGGSHHIDDLAKVLDVTPALVAAMLEDLGRMGYLRPLEGNCGSKCESCPVAGLCTSGGGGRVWVLTKKGNDCCASEIKQG